MEDFDLDDVPVVSSPHDGGALTADDGSFPDLIISFVETTMSCMSSAER